MRCCDTCADALDNVAHKQRKLWRRVRLEAYLQGGQLLPYFDVAIDTHAHKARRLLEGTLFVTRKMPLGASATITVEAMDTLWKFGPPGLAGLVLRRQFIEAAELLRKVYLETKTKTCRSCVVLRSRKCLAPLSFFSSDFPAATPASSLFFRNSSLIAFS